jgi:hypothetical protein
MHALEEAYRAPSGWGSAVPRFPVPFSFLAELHLRLPAGIGPSRAIWLIVSLVGETRPVAAHKGRLKCDE